MSSWQGKVAVVCGGTSGLGLAVAGNLVQQKAERLVLIARNAVQLERTATKLRQAAVEANGSTEIVTIAADLSNRDSAQRAADRIGKIAAAVDLVVQAAGASDRGTIAGLSRERLIELVDANVVTSLHAVQVFAPLLKTNRGVIVMIGSLSSFFAPRYLSGYSIAKHGLVALAQQSRLELAGLGVHVTLCCPGPIASTESNTRYQEIVAASRDLPAEANRPGGGAKVNQLDPQNLARDILKAASNRKILLVRPRIVWWLRLVSLFSPILGDSILRSKSQ